MVVRACSKRMFQDGIAAARREALCLLPWPALREAAWRRPVLYSSTAAYKHSGFDRTEGSGSKLPAEVHKQL